MCVAIVEGVLPEMEEKVLPEKRQAVTALYWLLQTHRCIFSVQAHLDSMGVYLDMFSTAVLLNTSVKILKLHLSASSLTESICSMIPCLKSLEELECKYDGSFPGRLFKVLAQLLRSTTSLVTLKITSQYVENETGAEDFFAALKSNCALQDLCLVYDLRNEAYISAFRDYLKTTAGLSALTIVAAIEVPFQADLGSVLEALLVNRTLSCVNLQWFLIDLECMQPLARFFSENVFRAVHFAAFCRVRQREQELFWDSFIRAIKESETLEELSLPAEIWDAEHWASLFKALPNKTNLKKVTILSDTTTEEFMADVCRALVGSGAEEKVFLGDYCYDTGSIVANDCGAFLAVSNWRTTVDRAVLQRLSSLGPITKARFRLPPDSRELSCSIADIVAATPTLTELILSVSPGFDAAAGAKSCWTVILDSLARNPSICGLLVSVDSVGEDDIKRLADAVKTSRRITTFFFRFEKRAEARAFVRHFSVGIAANYSLTQIFGLGMEPTEDCIPVLDTVRRNRDLVARAALFAKSSRSDKYTAAAADTVSRNPALVQELAQLVMVSVAEASEMLRRALRATESMNDFMRFAGIVKQRVACHQREDRCMQLDDMHPDCWRHLRQYLLLDDIEDTDSLSKKS